MNTLYDFAFSEQGYNHIKAKKVCQDSSGHYSDDNMSIAVVADGHGSDNYPRTDLGSRFAVEAAITAIRDFATAVYENQIDIAKDSNARLEQLSKNILANWYEKVYADANQHSFSEKELSKVSDKYRKRYLLGERIEKAYGTTLIAVCQTATYWFGLQIGDGRCVCIADDGTMSEPIPWDEDCQANITTSICDADAINEFRYYFTKDCPVATLMGSDGIDDSYANSEELYVLYRSILAIFAEHGQKVGETEIQEFLPGLSRKGSGDDVSIAGIISSTLSGAFIGVLKAQCEFSNAKSERERTQRDIILASEKYEYVLSALEKAKMNYELCREKETEALVAIKEAEINRAASEEKFEIAKLALDTALTSFQKEAAAPDVHKGLEEVMPETAENKDIDIAVQQTEAKEQLDTQTTNMETTVGNESEVILLCDIQSVSESYLLPVDFESNEEAESIPVDRTDGFDTDKPSEDNANEDNVKVENKQMLD